MMERGKRGRLVGACAGVLALSGLTLVCGCKKADEATGTGRSGRQAAGSQEAGAGRTAGQGRARGGRARGGRRGGGMGMGGSFRGGASQAAATPEAAQVASPQATTAPGPAREMPEADRAKKIREFASLYGPVTLCYEKNWDGRILQWVMFTYRGAHIKMPLSMVLDVAKPKELEDYFVIYPASGSPGKGTVTYKITATSAVPPAPKQPEAPKPPTPPTVTAAATTAGASASRAGAGSGRGGRRAGRGSRGPQGFGGMRG